MVILLILIDMRISMHYCTLISGNPLDFSSTVTLCCISLALVSRWPQTYVPFKEMTKQLRHGQQRLASYNTTSTTTSRRDLFHCSWNCYKKHQMTGTRRSWGSQQWSHGSGNNHLVFICQYSVGTKLPCSDSLENRGFTKSKRLAEPCYKALSGGGGDPGKVGLPRRKHSK